MLVTGAGGFVGGATVRTLVRTGHAVRAGTRSSCPVLARLPGVEVVRLDLTRPDTLAHAVEGVEALVHLAAVIDPSAPAPLMRRVNVEGTRSLWEEAARVGVGRAVYCSTVSVYGLLATSNGPIDEETTPRAFEPYGRSKLAGERAALETKGISTRILRPVAIFGPGERSALGSELRQVAISRIALPGMLHQRRFSFIHVEDVARALAHLLDPGIPPSSIYNAAADPVSFDHAVEAYEWALARLGTRAWRARLLARVSSGVRRAPNLGWGVRRRVLGRWVQPVGRTGHERVFDGRKLVATGFEYEWHSFREVLLSSLQPESSRVDREEHSSRPSSVNTP